jgi:S1-C subfamily serine protease
VVKAGAASPAGTAVAAQGGAKELWRGVAAPTIAADAVKPSLIREFGIEVIAVPGGVKVTGVMGNSFASRGGATAGDIIIGCNGAKVRDLVQFQDAVGAMVPESNAKITVLRNGRTRDLSIMVGEGEMEAFLPIQKP